MKSLLGLILAWVLPAGFLFSQSAPAEPAALPSGPLFRNRAPEMASWTISRRLGEPKAEEAGAVEKEDPVFAVAKTGKIYRVIVTDDRGVAQEVWSDGTLVAVVPSGEGVAQLVAPAADRDSVNPLYQNFARADFDGFEWISAKNFRGARKVQDRECLVFLETFRTRLEPVPGENGAIRESVEEREACIDAATRLPVSLKNANGTFIYRFQTPPATMQALPASVAALVEKRRQIERSLTGRAVKPF